jgi:hypothetical protein
MRPHVHRHAIDGDGNVRAVVEIEAAKEVLVRLAFAAVLRDDQSGHGFQHFARAIGRLREKLAGHHHTLARRLRNTDIVATWIYGQHRTKG